jgi:methylated-DNA-[protein]-cysteine S-methyltransferase
LRGLDRFHSAIYRALAQVGYGETTTYGKLAAEAGFPSAARETGAALGRNPIPLVLPCHRVLAAGGALGGFSAPGGPATKEKLLALEGLRLGAPEDTQTAFAF